ncbi:YoaK family protein [Thioclava dalianensis]|uniref:YoaK family protein n=1 Tax=Thioclava dalianensis TaxID=1185766 RepID=UPI00068A38D5|nr:YoaK family protein [Thioclava dalianensis]
MRIDLRLAVWLSLVAGAVNAAGFRALGYFSANMTGNVSAASDFLSLGRFATALWLLGLLIAFVLGAFASGLLIDMGERRDLRGIYAFSILLEAALLICLGGLDLIWTAAISGHLMMIGLSFVMGLQNAATTRISDGRVRTTHVSGIATDIGLGFAALMPGAGRSDDTQITRARLLLHLATLGSFFAGGLAGVWGYERIGPMIFILIAGLLIAAAAPELRKVYRHGAPR